MSAPDASRECGSQPAHQSLSTDVQEASLPPVREEDRHRPKGAAGRSRPEVLTADIRGVDGGHQSLIVSGPSADCVMVVRQAAWSTRPRSSSNPARPYMVRLIVFSRLI